MKRKKTAGTARAGTLVRAALRVKAAEDRRGAAVASVLPGPGSAREPGARAGGAGASQRRSRSAALPKTTKSPTRRSLRIVEKMRTVERALLSVYDKEGIVEFARGLHGMGTEILSTGGTARFLLDNGIPVSRVAGYTGFPEMLDGRVKTLHPKIHAGIMAVRGNKKHMADIRRAGIKPIDLVVCNLYPFEKTAGMGGIGFDEIVEMIDVGGPTMVRAAAKNFRHVGVIVDPLDYRRTLAEIQEHGYITEPYRFDLAKRAFRHVAAYDSAIFAYLSRLRSDGTLSPEAQISPYPDKLTLEFIKAQDLRYGENPHQSAGFYREIAATGPSIAAGLKVQGKELSFNNVLDLDAALALICEFEDPACGIVKHTNPCGVAVAETAKLAYEKAHETDPVSAFGGVIGFNVPVDHETAAAISGQFVEAIVAPSFTPAAIEIFSSKKALRLIEVGNPCDYRPSGFDFRRVNGGLLVQEWDRDEADRDEFRTVTRRAPTHEEVQAMRFAMKVAKHVRSNAVVYAARDRTLGIGAGQMSRVDAARLGALKARQPLRGAVVASDAFFPFRDGIDEIATHGVRAIIQPGGSMRDEETIAAADEHDLAMIFTGYRHFRH